MATQGHTVCDFPDCAADSFGYKYCRAHNAWIRANKLCYNCRQIKEAQEHQLCSICFLAEQQKQRQLLRARASEQGLCSNYWKCVKPASIHGGMCADCFHEYQTSRGQVKPTIASVFQGLGRPVAKPAPTHKPFPKTFGKIVKTQPSIWEKKPSSVTEAPKPVPSPQKVPTPVPSPQKVPTLVPSPQEVPAPVHKQVPVPIKSPKQVPLEEAVDVADVMICKKF